MLIFKFLLFEFDYLQFIISFFFLLFIPHMGFVHSCHDLVVDSSELWVNVMLFKNFKLFIKLIEGYHSLGNLGSLIISSCSIWLALVRHIKIRFLKYLLFLIGLIKLVTAVVILVLTMWFSFIVLDIFELIVYRYSLFGVYIWTSQP